MNCFGEQYVQVKSEGIKRKMTRSFRGGVSYLQHATEQVPGTYSVGHEEIRISSVMEGVVFMLSSIHLRVSVERDLRFNIYIGSKWLNNTPYAVFTYHTLKPWCTALAPSNLSLRWRSMTPPVAIVGGGPAGLVLGRLLEVANIDYIIFERDEGASQVGQGGSLDVHADSRQLAQKEAGLFEKLESIARYDAQKTTFADSQGNVIIKRKLEDGSRDRPEVDRKDLRALLLASVPSNKVRWASRLHREQKEAEGSISLHFNNEIVESGFRLVFGANGAWQKVRNLVSRV